MGRQSKGVTSTALLPTLLFIHGPLGRKFLIATTSIINGNTLIDAFGGTAGPVKG
jgi:hypothetical protein